MLLAAFCLALVASDMHIEVGRPLGTAQRLAVDPSGKFAITAAEDKTLRVWDLESGKLTRTERPPLGQADLGKLYYIALAPDGHMLAGGGWTGTDFDGRPSIYLFDLDSGKIKFRIGFLPHTLRSLAFSRDGQRVACGYLYGGFGVFSTVDGSMIGGDEVYVQPICGLDFDAAGRLAVASRDGYVRLYGADLKLVAKKRPSTVRVPAQVRFSPDGASLAVSGSDAPSVDVLAATDLSTQSSPSVAGLLDGGTDTICWSKDGTTLFAGGTAKGPSSLPTVRAWTKGSSKDVTMTARVTSLLPLGAGAIALDRDGELVSMEPTGNSRIIETRTLGDYRSPARQLRMNQDGTEIGFLPARMASQIVTFAIAGRRFGNSAVGLEVREALRAPGVGVAGWRGGREPSLNGVKLTLAPEDVSRAVHVLPDRGVLLGGDRCLYRFAANGKQIWSCPVTSEIDRVLASDLGKLVFASLGDGSYRWYRLSDGAELLALYPSKDWKDWVLWTPSGYFDCSQGAESLVGWVRNQDRPDDAFFPLGLFRRQFRRPELIDNILKSDAPVAPSDIESILPPTVQITSHHQMSPFAGKIDLRFTVSSTTSEPVTEIHYLVDGGVVRAQSVHITNASREITATLDLPRRDLTLTVVAVNRLTSSEPASVALKFRP
jgi:WD40 repeat protein